MHAYGISSSQRWRGGSGSVPARMEIKWFLNVHIFLSTTLLLWFPSGTICQLMLLMSISFFSNYDASLFKCCSLGLNPVLVR